MLSVKNTIPDDVWRAKASNTHRNSEAHMQEKNSSYTAMSTAKTENIIYLLECAIGGLQYVGETKHNNLVNDWIAT